MSKELTTIESEQGIQTTQTERVYGVSVELQPYVKEVHLFDSYVADTTHVEDQSVFETLAVGQQLSLTRENLNSHDSNAILVFTNDQRKIGYVPRRDNLIFARLMDAGKLLVAKLNRVEHKGKYHRLGIGIYLVDF